jgi:hypothetical protein
MEFKRSVLGTVIFVILAILSFSTLFDLGTYLYDLPPTELVLWDQVIMQILIAMRFIVYAVMIFIPLKRKAARYTVGVYFAFMFVLGAAHLVTTLLEGKFFYALVVDLTTIIDLLVAIALFMKPTRKFNKITPFYAVEGPIIAASP